MANFSKKLGNNTSVRKINPVEIYENLDRKVETGPLRPIQKEVLQKWHDDFKENKDIILKLHTGQGKTLIGLLILQSLLNQEKGPCLYICPNIYLANQTCEQAAKFGIPFTNFTEKNQDIPTDFINGEKLLICHVQKLFNGLTKFGLGRGSIKAGGIAIDDSHACIDSIKDTFTIKIPNDHTLYEHIVTLFEEDLKKQGIGTFGEIMIQDFRSFLPIPYWAWIEKYEKVTELLLQFREDKQILFKWPLLKNNIQNCQCFVSGSYIEISPYINPIELFGTFHNANQRILMSATTMNDSFFIKGLGLSKESINNPLTIPNERWSGEKMIIIPRLIDDSLDRISIINHFAKPLQGRKKGIVALIPSFSDAKIYADQKCNVATPENIYLEIKALKEGKCDTPLVIANRYDGIDLPDDACRLLIIDSKPFSESLADKYEESSREDSEIINVKIAQKIEQGLGRSVRGEKDYSVILLIGSDLVNFVRNVRTQKYFSTQTRQQIRIGLETAELATEDIDRNTTNTIDTLSELIRQCIITRDEDWKTFYEERMNKNNEIEFKIDITEILDIEKKAEEYNMAGDFDKAINLIQNITDSSAVNKSENGWYLQTIARYKYNISKTDSNKIQTSAFRLNYNLLKPKEGIIYKKIEIIDNSRVSNIKKWVEKFDNYEELLGSLNDMLSLISFEETADHFESGLHELGKVLGFESQRPDKENKEGPDNLWCLNDNDYIIFECKNEVKDKRDEISKSEAGQMNVYCGWFKNNYPSANYIPIMIIPTKNISKAAAFNLDVKILRKSGIKTLKINVLAFFKEIEKFDLKSLTDEKIQECLNMHKIDNKSIKTIYLDTPFQRR